MRVYTKRKFNYNGQELEHGQVFELVGARNDEKLLGLGYCVKVDRKTDVRDCGCGKSFVGDGCLRMHQVEGQHPRGTLVLADA